MPTSYEIYWNGEPVRITLPDQPSAETRPVVVFHGDSIIARWTTLPPTITNTGIGGDTSVALFNRFDADVLTKNPSLVVLEGGVNDLDRLWDPYAIADNMAAMIIHAKNAGAQVALLACLPTKYPHILVAAYNEELKAVALARDVPFVDTYTPFLNTDGSLRAELFVDGVHPNSAGYSVMWKAIRPYLPREAY